MSPSEILDACAFSTHSCNTCRDCAEAAIAAAVEAEREACAMVASKSSRGPKHAASAIRARGKL